MSNCTGNQEADFETPIPPDKSPWAARFGVFGDLPTRVANRSLAVTPWFLEPVLIGLWTLLFFGLAREQRQAVTANLRAMFPTWSRWRAQWGAWRVFWNFAGTFVDALRVETDTGEVDWAIDGLKPMEELIHHEGGCIVLTAHMGNYDLAAPVFAERFKRTLHAVRAPEREPATQRLREAEFRRREERYPAFRTHYNQAGNLLGVELARLLAQGDCVAVQGDRVLFEVAPMDVEVRPGLRQRLPKGPLFLARTTGAPCYPVFITRDGWRRYRVTLKPRIELPPRRRGAEEAAAQVWADAVFEVIQAHWNQWFVFEISFSRQHA